MVSYETDFSISLECNDFETDATRPELYSFDIDPLRQGLDMTSNPISLGSIMLPTGLETWLWMSDGVVKGVLVQPG
jgi:hypothetical protein